MNKQLYLLYYLLTCIVSGSVALSVHAAAVRESSSVPSSPGKDSLTVVIPVEPAQTKIDRKYLPSSQKEDTPLVHAIRKFNTEKVKELIGQHVNGGYQNNLDQTALMIAVDCDNKDAAELVLHEYPGTIDIQDVTGATALIYALRAVNHPMVKLLLESGANPLIATKDKEGVQVSDQTPLMIAARHNDEPSMQLLLNRLNEIAHQQKVPLVQAIEQVDSNGDTALQIAMQWRARDAVKLLHHFSGSVDLDALQLINAAKSGDVKTVKALIAKKIDVNYQYAGQTPLIAAVYGDALPAMRTVVDALLHAGANPNVLDVRGRTPLSIMASRHFDDAWKLKYKMKDAPVFSEVHCAIITMLLDAGANIEGVVADVMTSKRRSTPLIDAIANFNPDVVELLIERGANIQAQYNGKTVEKYLQAAIEKIKKYEEDAQETYDQWLAIQRDVKDKLESGAKSAAADPRAQLLIDAARAGDAKTVEALVQQGVNVNSKIASQTPLLAAVQGKDPKRMLETVTILLHAGADPNILDAAGNSALAIIAARHLDPHWRIDTVDNPELNGVHINVITTLLAGKANIDGGEIPPILAALMHYNIGIATELMLYGANLKAQYKGNTVSDYIQDALSNAIQPQFAMYDKWISMQFAVALELSPLGDTLNGALLQAINFKDEKRVAELLAHKQKPDLEIFFNGYRPLLLAVERNNANILKLLIQAGADINRTYNNGETLLMRALGDNYIQSALFLIKHGLDVNARDRSMNTPLMYFTLSDLDIHVLQLLLQKGALVSVRNKDNQSAIDIVQSNSYADPKIKAQVIQILQEAGKRELEAQKKRE